MKKVLLSACLAAMLIAAFAVTGLAVDISGPSEVKSGDTVTLTVTGDGEGTSGKVNVQGLEIVGVSGSFSTPADFLVVEAAGGMSTTYTCKVTAAPGGTVSFSVSDVIVSNGQADSAGSPASWQASVASEAEPTDEPTQQPSDEPSQVPSSEPSGDASVQPSASQSAGTGQQGSATSKPSASATAVKGDKLPKTGDATMDIWVLAVIGAACAAAVVIAGKKVFFTK